MARRQTPPAPNRLGNDPRLNDESAELWRDDLNDLAKALLTSAVRCFAHNGYHATTTRDIANGVRRSPAALYVYFTSKEHALYEIIRSAHKSALAYIDDPVVQVGDAAERLRLIVARHTAWHARHHVAARVSQYELAALAPQHYQEVLEIRHRTNERFRDAVKLGIVDGCFPDVDVQRIVRAMLSLSIDVSRWYRLDGPESPEQLGDFYGNLALHMVIADSPDRGPRRRADRAAKSSGRGRTVGGSK